MRILSSVDAISLTDAPTSPERILADRKAQVRRATTGSDTKQIPCPGGCGAMAFLESPLVVTRNGETRTIQVAQCLGDCRREVQSPRGKSRLVPARFDLLCPTEAAVEQPASNELPSLLAAALRASGLRQGEVAAQIGVSQSVVSKMMRDHPVAAKTASAAMLWARSVLDELGTESVRVADSPAGEPAKEEITNDRPTMPEPPKEPQVEATTVPQPEATTVPQQLEATTVPQLEATTVPQPEATTVPQPEATTVPQPVAKTVPQPEATTVPQPEATTVPQPVALEPVSTSSELMVVSKPLALAQAQPVMSPANPYETVLRTLLEQVAQRHLEEIAGAAAEGVVVRVTLEWSQTT